ncbi:MAG: hypothetical protein IPL55_14750 [Saprospiraceae bacterium]|jgi:hypothetical protein|nr:hypothetical protein [Saprospiraceae bacterium]MBL0026314.1 hypothetical protein [Saprospiraceae bacterium]
MIHSYTQNQIIQFVYRECDLFTKLEMEFAMEDDSTLMDEYQAYLTSSQVLPDVRFSPKNTSVNNILQYSKLSAA